MLPPFTEDDAIYLDLLIGNRAPSTPEEVDAVLRSEGFDPDQVAKETEAVVFRALREASLLRSSRRPRRAIWFDAIHKFILGCIYRLRGGSNDMS